MTKTLEDLINERKDKQYEQFAYNFKSYPVTQLKRILSTELKENDIRYPLSKKRKEDVIKVLRLIKYDLTEPPEKAQRSQSDVLRKYSTKKYSEDEQVRFMEEEYNEDFDPLQARKEYFNTRTNKFDLTVLQNHQRAFIRKFILSNVQGAIVFHGVGTGKTLTAVVASHYYLSVYPSHRVIVVSPPALVFNFIEGMRQYGINIQDNRYAYFTYEGFIRNYTKQDLTDALIIVDEAHNFRTKIIAHEAEDQERNKTITISSNKRGYHVLEAMKQCHKGICLTGTPFINKLYDIENLMSMIDKKIPLDENQFAFVVTGKANRNDYFKYKISHYENDNENDDNFPRVNNIIQPVIMNARQLKRYEDLVRANPSNEIDSQFLPDDVEGNVNKVNAFYGYPRQYSNFIDDLKLNFIVNKIIHTGYKTIIYTTFISNGVKRITSELRDQGISYSIISGKENKTQKEKSRQDFNDDKSQVLIISKAGTEGVDTKGCRQIFIMESLWNEALTNQAIARAVRYKSHVHLPKEEQRVDVYRLILAKKNDVDILNKINESIKKNKKIDYFKILERFKLNEQKMKLMEDSILDSEGNIDKSKIKKLPPELRAEAYGSVKFNKFEAQNEVNNILKEIPSVDTRLLVMALAKQQTIVNFIQELNKIPNLEDYQSDLEQLVDQAIKKGENPKNILKIQKNELKKQRNNIIKVESANLVNIMDKIEADRLKHEAKLHKVKRYQEFFTPDKFVKNLIKASVRLNREFEHLNILEPTAGVGNLVIGVLKQYDNCNIDMVEIQEDNRKILEDLVASAPDILSLKNEGGFLRFIPDKNYDVIIMNPPYHLQKKYISTYDRDYYDMDFVMKAFSMLEVNGEIVALVRYENTQKDNYKDWLESLKECQRFDYFNEKWKGQKEDELSKIGSINLTILRITKTEDDENTELYILANKRRKEQASLAEEGVALNKINSEIKNPDRIEEQRLEKLTKKISRRTKLEGGGKPNQDIEDMKRAGDMLVGILKGMS